MTNEFLTGQTNFTRTENHTSLEAISATNLMMMSDSH